jgi:hypothetical protein
MSIVLLGSTSGSCTLQEQAVAGTTVLTLPTTSGTVALTSDIPTVSTSFGGIGTYVVAGSSTTTDAAYAAGTTFAGSTLQFTVDRGTGYTQSLSGTTVPAVNSAIGITNYGLTGTWRLMSFMRGQDGTLSPVGLFVRIS